MPGYSEIAVKELRSYACFREVSYLVTEFQEKIRLTWKRIATLVGGRPQDLKIVMA